MLAIHTAKYPINNNRLDLRHFSYQWKWHRLYELALIYLLTQKIRTFSKSRSLIVITHGWYYEISILGSPHCIHFVII